MDIQTLFRTRFWLWAAIVEGLILAAGFIPVVRSDDEWFDYWGCWGVVFRGGAFVGTPADTALALIFSGGLWAISLTALGWLLHRVALVVMLVDSDEPTALGRDSMPQNSSDRLRFRRTIIAVALALAVVVPVIAVVKVATASARHSPDPGPSKLRYPGGVQFNSGRVAWWFASDSENPGPCPLGIHFPGVDLDGTDLASPERLRRLGWGVTTEGQQAKGLAWSEVAESPGRSVKCSFLNGRLIVVHARVFADDGGPLSERVEVSLGGRRVALPTTSAAILAELGPSLPRD